MLRRRLAGTAGWLAAGALLSGCPPQRDCTVDLWYAGDGSEQAVSVVGDWNGWDPAADPLEALASGGWHASLTLPPGDQVYQLQVDGQRVNDPFAALLDWDPRTGTERSRLRVADCAEPLLTVRHATATPAGALTVEARFLRADSGAWLDADTAVATHRDGRRLPVQAAPSAGTLRVETTGLQPGKHTVTVQAADRDGRDAAPLRVSLWVEPQPFQWEDALIYQVVLDRFATATGPVAADGWGPDGIGRRLGGTLAGLERELKAGTFEALGVNVLWLSPLADNPEGLWAGQDGQLYEGYHGYWARSVDAVEPALGTAEEVEALVQAAHARGMRVVLDVVPNHVHEQHPYRQQHAADGWFNESPDCICGDYSCPWSSDIETCWFTPYLPDLDWTHPEVARTVTADTLAWATRFDLDGFRVDAVPMMPRAAVRELTWAVREQLDQGPTRFFLLGETFTGAGQTGDIQANLGPFGLDGQFDFPVMWALRAFLAWESADAADLEAVLQASEAAWAGADATMAQFVGNHDVSRFVSEAAGDDTTRPWEAPPDQPADALPYDKLVLAQALAFSLPGAAVLYQGDEVGLAGATDPDCRRPLPSQGALSDAQQRTRVRTARMGRARTCSKALRRGQRVPLVAEGTVFAHLRDAGDGEPAVVLVNAGAATASVSVPLPSVPGMPADLLFRDVVDGAHAVVFAPGRTTHLSLPPWTARIYLPDSSACQPLPEESP